MRDILKMMGFISRQSNCVFRTKARKRLRLLLLTILAPSFVLANTFTGKCIGVSDGDTISVMKEGRAVKIHLEGIGCPELHQDFGNRAKQFTSSLVFGKDVQVNELSRDRYGRMVAKVYVGNLDVCLELVKAGLAWHFKRYSSDPVLAAAEIEARAAKKGLWSMRSPVPPWEWRKEHRR